MNKINRLELDKDALINFMVISMTIPSVTDVPGGSLDTTKIHCIESDNSGDLCHEVRGLRPLIYFTFLPLASQLEPGDEVLVGKWLFEVISQNKMITKHIVGYTPYAHKHQMDPDYAESAVFDMLTDWYDHTFSEPRYKVKKVPCDAFISLDSITLPSRSKLFPYASHILKTDFPYWVNDRVSEYSGYYIDCDGQYKTCDIYEELNIAPMLTLDKNGDDFGELYMFDYFEYKGWVFLLLDDISGLSLCVNPIATSCYSTGICELGTEDQENAFYKASEACEVLNTWKLHL